MHTSALMDATITCHLLDATNIRCPQSRTSGLPAHAWISPGRSRCHHGMGVCHAVHQRAHSTGSIRVSPQAKSCSRVRHHSDSNMRAAEHASVTVLASS